MTKIPFIFQNNILINENGIHAYCKRYPCVSREFSTNSSVENKPQRLKRSILNSSQIQKNQKSEK